MHIFEQLLATQAGLLIAFICTAALVVVAGIHLSIYGDALGDRTGLGGGLIGLIFLAAVTSLPELVVSITSVIQSSSAAQGADLAAGNMLGSNIFNLLILALVALFFPRKFDTTRLDSPHTATTLYGLIMLALFSIAFALSQTGEWLIPGLQCSWPVLLLPIAYGFMLRREHQQQSTADAQHEEEHLPAEDKLTHMPAVHFYSILALLCLLIIGGGIMLSILGSRMALPPEQGGFGLEASLIGTLFLAISTSLPELVISFSSVRLGFLDMAVGNVLGSNLFNLLIIFVADLSLRGAALLNHATPRHWTSVGLIFLLTLLAGTLLRTRTKAASATLATIMLLTYLTGMILFM